MEILDFDLNRESSFSSLRGSKEALLGVPGRSFYEVLRFFQKKIELMTRFFYVPYFPAKEGEDPPRTSWVLNDFKCLLYLENYVIMFFLNA